MAKTIPIKRGDHYFVPPIEGFSDEMRAVPSVTTILKEVTKEALTNWAVAETAKFAFANPGASLKEAMGARWRSSGQAAVRGKTIHSWIEAHENGAELVPEDLPEDVRPFGIAFEKYVNTFKPHVVHLEMPVANLTHGYGGTLDALQIDASERTLLVDYKTGKAIYSAEQKWQLSAYLHAEWLLRREGVQTIAYPMPKVDGAMIILLKPDGNFAVEEVADDFSTFLAYKHVWYQRWSDEGDCPNTCFCKHLEAITRDVQLDRMAQESEVTNVLGG